MVRLIDECPGDENDETFLTFKVYLSPKDKVTVLGYVEPKGFQTGSQTVVWLKTDFGVPVREAFLEALSLCESRRIGVLWINDPDNLFPPDRRPVRSVGE